MNRERAQESIFAARYRATTFGVLILITLIAFESMAVSAALPTAARDVHGLASYGWAFTGFLVANIVGMVASGLISDSRGPRPALVAGLIGFLAGLLLAGSATTMLALVAGRVVQGVGGGLIITAVYVVIGRLYPERMRPSVFAASSSAWVVPSLVGPVVSGLLAEHASWRLVFLGLTPFVVVGAVLLVPVLRSMESVHSGGPVADPAQLARAVALAAGIALLEQAGQHPSGWSLAGGAAGLVLAGWGIRRLLPVGTLRVRPGVSAPVALRALLSGSFFGTESIIPLMLGEQHGFSPAVAGLPLAVSGCSWAAGSFWQSKVDDSAGTARRRGLIRAGFALVATAAIGVALTSVPAVPGGLIFAFWLLAGLGAGLTMSSVGVLLLKFTTDADRGADSAALQLADVAAGALTTGTAGVLIAAAARGAITYTAAFTTLGLLMAVIASLGVVFAGRARARPAGERVTGTVGHAADLSAPAP